MIRHILLIRFTSEVKPAQIASVREAFLSLPLRMQGVVSVEWGENNSREGKNAGYTHCVMMTFFDEQARQLYLPHPQHEAIKAIFRPILNDIIVFDYDLDPPSPDSFG
ncbi:MULTISPECIES: Dabb family protein [Enterobacteriaceae]|uniref:Stress responsive A/B Barrel Domain protein n=1 Tax=Klebsiella variicola TaxID=244366 RepID=A0A1U9Y6E3_KLEVA|nr:MULTISPECIES: Dabb family protein [Enterobacteriaceae]AQZ36585.1 Stress responsive A/B Barrel Domain protein [Klebsiella variicola]MBF2792929.1 Dabb family protein [Enterobacter asburiae]MDS1915876.1 Dabb family protein [Enterobacter asburiae]MDW3565471.1 Dabb family protein [Enterobacter asburiae]MDW3575232.1 Dabb family protein [Enterobacter asburiae]